MQYNDKVFIVLPCNRQYHEAIKKTDKLLRFAYNESLARKMSERETN